MHIKFQIFFLQRRVTFFFSFPHRCCTIQSFTNLYFYTICMHIWHVVLTKTHTSLQIEKIETVPWSNFPTQQFFYFFFLLTKPKLIWMQIILPVINKFYIWKHDIFFSGHFFFSHNSHCAADDERKKICNLFLTYIPITYIFMPSKRTSKKNRQNNNLIKLTLW